MSMNLADYARQPKNSGTGDFIKWTRNGESKILRFLYTSHDGSDIEVVKKEWSDEQHKFLYDTPNGKLTCVLNAVLYENGQPPKRVRWERSAAFTEQVCNGYWSKFPRICDGVWEVTCQNPGTKEIKFSWFPVMGADLTNYPLPDGVSIIDGRIVYSDAGNLTGAAASEVSATSTPAAIPQAQAAPRPVKYWE